MPIRNSNQAEAFAPRTDGGIAFLSSASEFAAQVDADSFQEPIRSIFLRNSLAALTLGVGVLSSVLLFALFDRATENVARLRFEREAREAMTIVQDRVQFYSATLYAMRALFSSQNDVTRLQFKRFVESLELVKRFPGFDVVNYAFYVRREDKQRFVDSVRRDTSIDPAGYPNFNIHPAGDRDEYYVLAYLEPMVGFEFAFGRDLASNSAAADPTQLIRALHAARDSGEITASGSPIKIKSRGRQYMGLAIRLAVYRSGYATSTIDERRRAYMGSVGAGFSIDDLMDGIVDLGPNARMRLQVYDVKAVGSPNTDGSRRLLFDSLAAREQELPSAPTSSSHFETTLRVEVGGREWEAAFTADKSAVIGRLDAMIPWLVLLAGLVITVLLTGIIYAVTTSRSRARAIAAQMTQDLRQKTSQLQALSRQLVDTQETERRQLSRELHDQVGQNLTALAINLDIMKSILPTAGTHELHRRLEDSSVLVESTTNRIENVMAELRPPMLDDYGLLPALQWLANQFSNRTEIRTEVKGVDEFRDILPDTEIALFRVAQEALNNIAKHAHATKVSITLSVDPPDYVMTITDDGIGLSEAASQTEAKRHGLGMMTMRERVQAVRGEFDVGPTPGGGVRVTVRVSH